MFNQSTEKTCKTCGESHDKKLKFCPNCGVNSRYIKAAKLKNCKECGHSIAANAVKCPSCGKKTNYTLKSTLLAVGVVFVLVLLVLAIVGTGNENTKNNNPTTAESSGSQSQIVYSDDFFDIEYMNLYDIPDNNYINCSYIKLKVTNKSDKKVTLMLDDVYVNDIAVESGTGMPITLEPNKISTTPFILFTGNTGLSAEDITKVEFVLTARDDSFSRIHTTSKITVTK